MRGEVWFQVWGHVMGEVVMREEGCLFWFWFIAGLDVERAVLEMGDEVVGSLPFKQGFSSFWFINCWTGS